MNSGQGSKLAFPVCFGPYIQKAISLNKFSWPTRGLRVNLQIKRLLSFKETHILSTLSYVRITGVSVSLESISKENFLTLSCTVLTSPFLHHTIFSKKQFVTVMNYPIIMHYLARREEQAVHWFQFTSVCFYWFLSSVNLNVFIVISWPHLHWKCYQRDQVFNILMEILPSKNPALRFYYVYLNKNLV